MKTVSMFILLLFVVCSSSIFAQQNMGNIVVITKYQLATNVNGFVPGQLDSLTSLYSKAISEGNEYILEFTTLRHYWGNSNSDYVVIYKVRSWEDVPKANDRMEELFSQVWNTEELRNEFDTAYNKYFTGHHSDEIYREIK